VRNYYILFEEKGYRHNGMRHQILSMVRGRTASRGGYEKAQAAGAKTKNKRIEEAAAPV